MAGQGTSETSLFTEPEVEFLAEDETINIIPNVRMETLHMICGDFGPFRPQIPVTVPLWLGVAMKKRSKCRIQPPEWMSVERLTEVLEEEREAPREFQPLPFHYVEIARLLLDNAREDFENNFMVQSLLEDIKDVRWDKVEKGLKTLSGRTHAVKLKNLSAMEVNRMRNFTVRALQSFYKHDSEDLVKLVPADDSQTSSAPSDRFPRVLIPPLGRCDLDERLLKLVIHNLRTSVWPKRYPYQSFKQVHFCASAMRDRVQTPERPKEALDSNFQVPPNIRYITKFLEAET